MDRDLLDQAEHLAKRGAKKPKQADLRRAVSAAYYALFHALVHEACCALIGTQHSHAPYRHVLGRAFAHGTMKQACESFGGGTLKKGVAKGLPANLKVPKEVKEIADAFVELQEKRHLADYDRTERFRRSDVLTLVGQAKQAISHFRALPSSVERKFFLACLWAWKELSNR